MLTTPDLWNDIADIVKKQVQRIQQIKIDVKRSKIDAIRSKLNKECQRNGNGFSGRFSCGDRGTLLYLGSATFEKKTNVRLTKKAQEDIHVFDRRS